MINISKKQTYQKYFIYNKSNIKNIWKGIKEIVTLKSKSFASPSKIITSENKTLLNPTDIANEFNNYFANLGEKVSLSIPKVNASFCDFLSAPIHHSFLLTHAHRD